jgi:tRNA (adenine22-N1)-methyltransferase
MTLKLGSRLQAVADSIPAHCRSMADIGSDHAALPVYLLQTGRIDRAVAGEYREGPWGRAQEAVRAAGLEQQIVVRSGDGLAVLEPGEVDVVVLAGLGGDVITAILQDPAAPTFPYWIIQAMTRAHIVRQFLAASGGIIAAERLVRERGRFYTVMQVRPGGSAYELTSAELEWGPLILRQRDPAAREYFSYLYQKNRRLRDKLRQHADLATAAEAVQLKLNILEAILDST